ncbi:MAG: cysteine desulfurase [Myxococcales bacterium]|nr:cysteine desulfurase [Myxococcales bacterium]
MSSLIYLDNQATTRCDPRVLERMLPYFSEHYGNAASTTHSAGWMAQAAVNLAREQVAASIGGLAGEVFFCSGATEANNLALRGAASAYSQRGKHLVVAATEHASVLDCARDLQRVGWELSIVPVSEEGLITREDLRAALRDTTTVVSIMLANNETGVIADIVSLAASVRERCSAAVFHCDAVAGLGKIPIDVGALGVDVLTISAHKIHGPKGVGALWRRSRPRLVLEPQIVGGGHERGLRSGTLPVPLLVGFGRACEIASSERLEESARLGALRDRLLAGLQTAVGGIEVNGSTESRISSNLNIAIEGVSADSLVSSVRDIAMSTGSACSSAVAKPSHVLAAMMSAERAHTSIRLGLGRFTTEEDVETTITRIGAAASAERGT